jgi:hypothetical protein
VRIRSHAVLFLVVLSLVALNWSFGHAASAHQAPAHVPGLSYQPLSARERREAEIATRLAVRSQARVLTWLRRQANVSQVTLGSDHQTIEVDFRDRARFFVLPRQAATSGPVGSGVQRRALASSIHPAGPAAGKAIVLEPFATDLKLGPDAGKTEVDALQQAGFQADVLRDSAVTIAAIEKLSDYSVVYMETHSGVIGDDALVLTHEVDPGPYTPLFKDGSVVQGSPENDPGHIYLAFTSKLILHHMGTFPGSSIVFINGCSILIAPAFWNAFLQQNVSTIIAWDKKANNTDAEQAADFMFPKLAGGESVGDTLADTRAALLDTSFAEGGVSALQARGDLSDSFPKALAGAPPTPTPTPVQTLAPPTSTPTDTPTITPTATPPPVLAIAISGGIKLNQDSTVRVTVTDGASSEPVLGAQVALDGRKVGLPAVLKKKTGSHGQVVFKHLTVHRKGTIKVHISKSGFEAVNKSVKVKR